MIYLSNFREIETDIMQVGFKHNMPFDEVHGLQKTKEELEQAGILVEYVEAPKVIDGKESILCYDTKNNKLFYKYKDIQVAEDNSKEKIDKLENENVELKLALAEQQESTFKEITELKLALAELIESNIK